MQSLTCIFLFIKLFTMAKPTWASSASIMSFTWISWAVNTYVQQSSCHQCWVKLSNTSWEYASRVPPHVWLTTTKLSTSWTAWMNTSSSLPSQSTAVSYSCTHSSKASCSLIQRLSAEVISSYAVACFEIHSSGIWSHSTSSSMSHSPAFNRLALHNLVFNSSICTFIARIAFESTRWSCRLHSPKPVHQTIASIETRSNAKGLILRDVINMNGRQQLL